jgi:outer membrane protein
MRYFKFIFFGLIALSATQVQAQTDSVLSVRQCVDIAIKNNLDVRKSELQMERLDVGYKQAKEYMLPSLNGQGTYNFITGRNFDNTTGNTVTTSTKNGNYSLNSNLALLGGFTNLNAIKQTSLAYQAGKMDFQQAKDQVTINVITAYLQVLDNAELVGQVANQLEVSRKQVERLTILEKEGANKLPSDLYDLKGRYGDDQLSYVNAKNTLEVSKLNLMQILNIPYNKNLKLEPLSVQDVSTKTNATSEAVYSAALQLAYVKAAELRTQSAGKGVKVARGVLLPTLSLGSSIGTNYSSNLLIGGNTQGFYDQFKGNYATFVGFTLNIPILNYFQNRNKLSIAKIDLQQAKYVEDNTKIQLKQNVEQAYLNMTSAYERYTVLLDQSKAYQESFRVAEIRFNAGVLTTYEFVQAKNNFDRTNINLINSRYDCYIYNKILDYYQGRLAL